MQLIKCVVTIAVAAAAFTVRAAGIPLGDNLLITPNGYGAIEIGQIGHGYYKLPADFNRPVSKVWQQRALVNFGFMVDYRDFLKIDIAGEGMMAFSTPQLGKEPTTLQPRHSFYIKRSSATLTKDIFERLSFQAQIGYFQYKYNSDVCNLGEYMFRSNPYPLVIYSDFNYPMANLMGLRLNLSGFNGLFSNDILLHSELTALPVQNWSLSDVAEVNIAKIVTIGAGVSLHHLINVYQGKYMSTRVFDSYYYSDNMASEIPRTYSDTVLDKHAVKVMGRLAVDPKQIFFNILNNGEQMGRFNKTDGRIYGEINVLGTKDYPMYYEELQDRMIYSFGVNIPTLFILDLLNVELEYCSNQTAYSDERFYGDNRPSWEPATLGTTQEGDTLSRNPWRWSIYAKKTFFDEHVGFILQFARDHKKINFHYFQKSEMSFRETLPTSEDWWWCFRTEFKF